MRKIILIIAVVSVLVIATATTLPHIAHACSISGGMMNPCHA